MNIPNTQAIDVSAVSSGQNSHELFSFMIQDIQPSTYLDDFIAHLDDYLPEFVFSASVLAKHQSLFSAGKTASSPVERARQLLQKTTRGCKYFCVSGHDVILS